MAEQHPDFRFSPGYFQHECGLSSDALSALLAAHGRQPEKGIDNFTAFVFSQDEVVRAGYSNTTAVTITAEPFLPGQDKNTVFIRTLELGQEGDKPWDYECLAEQSLRVPYFGAWYWRETTLWQEIDDEGKEVWRGSCAIRAEAWARSRYIDASFQARRRLEMAQSFEDFVRRYGHWRIDDELARIKSMVEAIS